MAEGRGEVAVEGAFEEWVAGEPGDELSAGDEEAGGGLESSDGAGGFDGGEGNFEEGGFTKKVSAAEVHFPRFEPDGAFENNKEARGSCVHFVFGKEFGVASATNDGGKDEKVFEDGEGHSVKKLGVRQDVCEY